MKVDFKKCHSILTGGTAVKVTGSSCGTVFVFGERLLLSPHKRCYNIIDILTVPDCFDRLAQLIDATLYSFLNAGVSLMKYRRRVFFIEKQKLEIRDRLQRGESMRSIGRGFDRSSSSIYKLLVRTGGIRPLVLIRTQLALTLVEREEMSRGFIAKVSLYSIGRDLKWSVSTISREVKPNGGSAGYRATASDQRHGTARYAQRHAS